VNATAEYQSVLRSASDVAGKKTLHRDAVRAADDAAHDLHDVRGRLRFWAQVQAMTPFIAVGTAVAAVIVGLIFGSFLPAGTFRTGSFTLLALLVPAAVGAFVFWVATGVVAELRQQATRARSAVNLAERDLLAAGEDLADAENGYWARKRPTV
jgi:ABC-type transport system involved in cytochrome c biogenesis permease subunit